MAHDYFERKHCEETRYAEWRMLDESLARRTGESHPIGQRARVAIGHLLIQFGAHLAGDPVEPALELHTTRKAA